LQYILAMNETNKILNEESSNNGTPEIEKEDLGDEISLEPYDPSKISIDHQNVNLGSIIENLQHNEIRLDPEFQRLGDLWPPSKKSQLIESILLGLPLPSFYFSEEDSGRWEVVDGLQRLSTFKSFIVDETLTLHGLEFLKKYDGKKYVDLSREDKRKISGFKVNLYVINKQTPENVKFLIFKKVNTGGIILTPQEMRHALNQGTPAKLIKELAELIEFKKATDYKVSFKRQEDRDFINRFVAFYLLGYTEKYKGNLDEFLNDGMSSIKFLEEDKKFELKDNFKKSMTLAFKIFGDDAFRKRYNKNDKRKPISKAVYDTLSVNFALLNDTERNELLMKKNFFKTTLIKELNNDNSFSQSVTTATGNKEKVKYRFEKIKLIIQQTLKND
jgi:hypothetical protein